LLRSALLTCDQNTALDIQRTAGAPETKRQAAALHYSVNSLYNICVAARAKTTIFATKACRFILCR
jgi:hypothetical protein